MKIQLFGETLNPYSGGVEVCTRLKGRLIGNGKKDIGLISRVFPRKRFKST